MSKPDDWPSHPDVGPPSGSGIPYATMFKIDARSEFLKEPSVFCVKCDCSSPLVDLLTGRLHEDECPWCKTWAADYWKNKPHREVTDA